MSKPSEVGWPGPLRTEFFAPKAALEAALRFDYAALIVALYALSEDELEHLHEAAAWVSKEALDAIPPHPSDPGFTPEVAPKPLTPESTSHLSTREWLGLDALSPFPPTPEQEGE